MTLIVHVWGLYFRLDWFKWHGDGVIGIFHSSLVSPHQKQKNRDYYAKFYFTLGNKNQPWLIICYLLCCSLTMWHDEWPVKLAAAKTSIQVRRQSITDVIVFHGCHKFEKHCSLKYLHSVFFSIFFVPITKTRGSKK